MESEYSEKPTLSREISENEKRLVVDFMEARIKENELFVSKVFDVLGEYIMSRSEEYTILADVYHRIKESQMPSREELSDDEEKAVQTIWKKACREVKQEDGGGEYNTEATNFEPFEKKNKWFTEINSDETERYGVWNNIFKHDLVIGDIIFKNKNYGLIAYDLYSGGSTDIKIIVETLINPHKYI